RDPALRAVRLPQRPQVDVGEGVTRDDQEGLAAEVVAHVPDAPRRAEQLLLVGIGKPHPPLRAVAEAAFDLLGEIVQVADHVVEPVARQQADDVLHDRRPDHGHERLRNLVCKRAEPRTETRREEDRFQVPWSQLDRYFACSAVSSSIATPMLSSLSVAMSWSISDGSTCTF